MKPKPRMILLTAAAAAALAGAATQIAGGVLPDGRSSGASNELRIAQSSSKAPGSRDAREQTSTRAERLLHNPGLPPWIP